ncbi:MAG: hypothetical protein H3C31_02225 [Brumimicrobium sp.]|nr:hypothetical protein [Brumimicrobium sp.]
MVRSFFIFFLLTIGISVSMAQNKWMWTEVTSLPISTTNNALCEAKTATKKFVYSFGGVSDSLKITDIHQRVFKYYTNNDSWEEMPMIPDTAGKTGSMASYVNNKIYLIGGNYHPNDSTAISSNKVFVYNPNQDIFEAEGADLITPIADHVQAVWRDSLIYVVSGWSNSTILMDVQIYNPFDDTWFSGTPLPNDEIFSSHGASGFILGDTIFFYGGVNENAIDNKKYIIKGVIDKDIPSQITWSYINSNLGTSIFRGACSGFDKSIFWVGGADEAYQLNGKTLDSTTYVNPNQRLMTVNLEEKTQVNSFDPKNNVMDLRGIANLGGGNWMIAGGIDSTHVATNRAFLLHNPTLSNIGKALNPAYFEVIDLKDDFVILTENIGELKVYDLSGGVLYISPKYLADLIIPRYLLPKGLLLFVYEDSINLPLVIKKVNP